jgi:hypothetical protein
MGAIYVTAVLVAKVAKAAKVAKVAIAATFMKAKNLPR